MAPKGKNINWITTGFMVAFHIGALAALFFFSWKAFFVGLFLYWVAAAWALAWAITGC